MKVRNLLKLLGRRRLVPGADPWESPTVQASQMMKVLIVVEQTPTGFSAYSPDVEGCIATGATREEVERTMREAIEFHFEGLRTEGQAVPAPHSYATFVEVAA